MDWLNLFIVEEYMDSFIEYHLVSVWPTMSAGSWCLMYRLRANFIQGSPRVAGEAALLAAVEARRRV